MSSRRSVVAARATLVMYSSNAIHTLHGILNEATRAAQGCQWNTGTDCRRMEFDWPSSEHRLQEPIVAAALRAIRGADDSRLSRAVGQLWGRRISFPKRDNVHVYCEWRPEGMWCLHKEIFWYRVSRRSVSQSKHYWQHLTHGGWATDCLWGTPGDGRERYSTNTSILTDSGVHWRPVVDTHVSVMVSVSVKDLWWWWVTLYGWCGVPRIWEFI